MRWYWFHQPCIRPPSLTAMILTSISLLSQRGRLPTQRDDLTFDHRMTRACLHTDQLGAAHNRSAFAASSTAAPPTSALRQPWPHLSSAGAARVRKHAAVRHRRAPRCARLRREENASEDCLAWRCAPAVACPRNCIPTESVPDSWPPGATCRTALHRRWSAQKPGRSPDPLPDGSSAASRPDAPRPPYAPLRPAAQSRHPSPPAAAADLHAAPPHKAVARELSTVPGRHASTTSNADAIPDSEPRHATGFSPACATPPAYADEQSADGHPDPPSGKSPFYQQAKNVPCIAPVRLLPAHITGTNGRRIPDPKMVPHPLQHLLEPLRVAACLDPYQHLLTSQRGIKPFRFLLVP